MKAKFRKSNTQIYPYNRKLAYNYLKRWAFDRNPKFYDFEYIGGDCTNFASQVLHAGGCPMNYEKWTGWYFNSINDRAPAWTSVEYLFEFLISNTKRGPFAELCEINEVEIGDIIQINFACDEEYNHSPVVIRVDEPRTTRNIYIAAHTIDRFDYPLSNYNYVNIRCVHILGYRF